MTSGLDRRTLSRVAAASAALAAPASAPTASLDFWTSAYQAIGD